MIIDKEVYEHNTARFEVHKLQNGETQFWVQTGINGLYMRANEIADLYEILHAFINEEVEDE